MYLGQPPPDIWLGRASRTSLLSAKKRDPHDGITAKLREGECLTTGEKRSVDCFSLALVFAQVETHGEICKVGVSLPVQSDASARTCSGLRSIRFRSGDGWIVCALKRVDWNGRRKNVSGAIRRRSLRQLCNNVIRRVLSGRSSVFLIVSAIFWNGLPSLVNKDTRRNVIRARGFFEIKKLKDQEMRNAHDLI